MSFASLCKGLKRDGEREREKFWFCLAIDSISFLSFVCGRVRGERDRERERKRERERDTPSGREKHGFKFLCEGLKKWEETRGRES